MKRLQSFISVVFIVLCMGCNNLTQEMLEEALTEKITPIVYLSVASNITFTSKDYSPLVEPLSSFYLNFSEQINIDTIEDSISLIKIDDEGIEQDVDIDLNGYESTVSINVKDGEKLEEGYSYYVLVTTDLKSKEGHSLKQDFTGRFIVRYPLIQELKSTIVISDIHMGDNRANKGISETNNKPYGWFIQNKAYLVKFLEWVITQKDWIKEIVIAGDMLDEWVAPMNVDTYPKKANGSFMTEAEFAKSIAEANSEVIDAFLKVASEGIKLVYVPGNHDMMVTSSDIQDIFSSKMTFINTYDKDGAKPDVDGLGTYWPNLFSTPTNAGYVAIEHSHRYDVWNAPDYISNRGKGSDSHKDPIISGNHRLPVGFFVTKMNTTQVWEKKENFQDESLDYTEGSFIDTILSCSDDELAYRLAWSLMWKQGSIYVTTTENIKTGIDGYSASYSYNDIADWQWTQDTRKGWSYINTKSSDVNWWKEMKEKNNADQQSVTFKNSLVSGFLTQKIDKVADSQYFDRTGNTAQVVVFGHTHDALISSRKNNEAIYANSGTWVDDSEKTRNFVIIKPIEKDTKKLIKVGVYTFTSSTDIHCLGNTLTVTLRQ